jgi:hypothetical protein
MIYFSSFAIRDINGVDFYRINLKENLLKKKWINNILLTNSYTYF